MAPHVRWSYAGTNSWLLLDAMTNMADRVDKPVTDKPTVLVDNYRALGPQGMGTEQYKGLGVFACPGLHTFCADLLQRVAAPGAAVLELGAGSGAMSMRLADLGYRVTAVDIVADNFKAGDHASFVAADLNGPFARDLGQFDAVVALEIIEHLENPRHFLRQVRSCLRDGGHIVLSTPNLANPLSRVQFLIDGNHQWFQDKHYESIGHIMPLSPWLLEHCFNDSGLVPQWSGSFGDIEGDLVGWRRMRWLVRSLRRLSRIPRGLDGEIYTALLQARTSRATHT